MSDGVFTKTVSGAALGAYIDDLARLRISVFREYPYLYAGSADYERQYLETYLASGSAMAVLAFEGTSVIGASTGIPLAAENEAFVRPFVEHGFAPERVFYCGESVLLPAWRGRGLYRAFFSGREAYARALTGMTAICFCAVVRDAGDSRRPPDYEPLDAVWRHFGYAPRPGLVAHFDWQEVGADAQVSHAMQFWTKTLDGVA